MMKSVSQGVPSDVVAHVSHLPPVSVLFAAFLGYNPIQHLVGPYVLSGLSAHQQAALTSRDFFPAMISGPFKTGLHAALDLAIVVSLLAAAASWVRGGKYTYVEADEVAAAPEPVVA